MINLNNLANKINLMPNSKEKAIKICLLYSYLNFLYESKQISFEELEFMAKQVNESEVFAKHYYHEEEKYVNGILDATDKLNSMYKSILTHANNFDLFTVTIPTNVNIKKLFSYVRDFMNLV